MRAMLIAVVLLVQGATVQPNHLYVADGIVVDNNKFETADGNQWEYSSDVTATLKTGEHVKIVLENNATPNNIYDDIIDGVIK